MESKFIITATVTLPNSKISGSVTTVDGEEYLFRNTSSALDYYLTLKKDEEWYQTGGPEIQWPDNQVKEIGQQIDDYLNEK